MVVYFYFCLFVCSCTVIFKFQFRRNFDQLSRLYDQLIQRASTDDDVTKTRSRSAVITV